MTLNAILLTRIGAKRCPRGTKRHPHRHEKAPASARKGTRTAPKKHPCQETQVLSIINRNMLFENYAVKVKLMIPYPVSFFTILKVNPASLPPTIVRILNSYIDPPTLLL